jgi:K+-sensing histidine kinase KdpD
MEAKSMNIMVCVTNQKTCEKLIAQGMRRVAAAPGALLHIVHAVRTGQGFLGAKDQGDAIEYLFTAAQLAGAELTLLHADRVEETLAAYAKRQGVNLMILGAPMPAGPESFVARLQRRLPAVEFDTVY